MEKIRFGGRKKPIRAASFLVAAFVVVGALAIQGHAEAARYRLHLQNSYQHAFAELTTAMSELQTALEKGTYATSPALLSSLCTQVYGKAMTAQLALGELPYANVELEQTASFVAKAGDYALALSRSTAQNGGIGSTEREGLYALADGASKLSQTLQNLQSQLYDGAWALEDVTAAETRLSAAAEGKDQVTAGSTFQEMEADFPEVPSLIYDGPFSEHLTGRTPLALEGAAFVGQEEAAAAAGEFLGIDPGTLALISAGEGTLPAWDFSAPMEKGDFSIEVSKYGGKVVSLFSYCTVTNSVLSAKEAIGGAVDFLAQRGYPDMKESYWIIRDNIITINFAPVVGDVVIYPDLVKVSVALDDGTVTGFDAEGYLTNHRERDLVSPTVSAETAQKQVAGDLTVLAHQLALIPTAGEYEVLCHEFKCETADGRHVIVYVNATTGEQEKILLLIEDETGTLAI